MGSKALLKHHGEKRLTSSPKCVSEDPERKHFLTDTRHHQRVGFPKEVPSIAPGPHSKLRASVLGDHRTRHTQQSASGKGVPHATYTGICHCLLFQAVSQSNHGFISLSGWQGFKYFEFWATECSLTRGKRTLLCR